MALASTLQIDAVTNAKKGQTQGKLMNRISVGLSNICKYVDTQMK